MCEKNKTYIECLKCENMQFPDMPNGRTDFEQLCDIVGVLDALAFNPNMHCVYSQKFKVIKGDVKYE